MNIFITGTDTDVGKTYITISLALAFKELGKKVGIFKPLQSGAIHRGDETLAPDLEEAKKYSSDIKLKYSYLLDGEVSPSLAAKKAGITINPDKIKSDFEEFKKDLDIVLVEGAGGLYCPATNKQLMADIIKLLDIPAIIVARPNLGTVNHTLMTIECAKQKGINILGVIINRYPTKTEDDAIINVKSQIEDFTDVKVIATVYESNSKQDLKELIQKCLTELNSCKELV